MVFKTTIYHIVLCTISIETSFLTYTHLFAYAIIKSQSNFKMNKSFHFSFKNKEEIMYHFIVNPHSRTGQGAIMWKEIKKILEEKHVA